MKKILLVSGCSFTDSNWISEIHPEIDTSWPKWPELLAEKLDMRLINVAKSGAGNEYIYTSLLETITFNLNNLSDIGLVIPAWSSCQRKDYQQGWTGRWTNARLDPHGDVFSWVKRSLKYYLSFQILCERYNLPYMQVQMLESYREIFTGLRYGHAEIAKGIKTVEDKIEYKGDKRKDNKKVIEIIMNYDKKINEKNFIGWPIARELGGFSIVNKTLESENETDFRVSKLDSHPNKIGQERISEYIHDRLG